MTIVTDELYHVYNRSIAKFIIFNNTSEYSRMKETIQYYQKEECSMKFSKANNLKRETKTPLHKNLVQIICYCFMPTHIHLVLKQLIDGGISKFMGNLCNSYSRYFNIKHKRKGPLWESRFKRVHVATYEQLLHLTRYVHLNPATANLVENPMDWKWSSYGEYINDSFNKNCICEYAEVMDIEASDYKIFAEDRINDQKGLAKIKHLTLD